MLQRFTWRSQATALLLATAAFAQGCSSTDSTTTTGSIAVSLAPTSATIQQGGSTSVVGTLTLTNFTGTPTVTVENMPTGVTGTATISGNTATVVLTAASTTATGTYSITVRAAGTGLTDATATFTLTISAATVASYTMSFSPVTTSIAQGANAPSTLTLVRTNFTGNVALSVDNLPTGVTAAFVPTPVSTLSSVLTLTVSSTAVAGLTNLVIRGTAAGMTDVTAPLALTVTAVAGGSVRLDYSVCVTASKPVWVAFQDGTGAWTRVTGVSDVYSFTVASAKDAIAVVTASGAQFTTSVQYYTKAELTANVGGCAVAATTKIVNGSVLSLATNDVARMSLGSSQATVLTNTTFVLPTVLNGTFDFVGYRRNSVTPGVLDRGFLRRDQNIAAAGTLAVADFASGTESFAAATANATVTGAGTGDAIIQSMSYLAGAACTSNSLYSVATGTATTFAMFGVPSAQQRATDFHSLSLTDANSGSVRSVTTNFHNMADHAFAFGALLAPTVTTVTGAVAYKRLQAVLTLPADYALAVFGYSDTPGNTVSVLESTAWLAGSSAVTLAFPDFTGTAGLTTSWFPASAAAVNYSLTGISTPAAAACTEGAVTRVTTASGTM